MNDTGRPRIVVRLDKWQIDALKAHTAEKGGDMAGLMRQLIEGYMRDNNITRETYAAAIEGQISTDELGV